MASTPLVTLPAFQAYLGLEPGTDDAVLQSLLDGALAQFTAAVDRVECPFSDALPARIERIRGCPQLRIWLDYPIASIAAIQLGSNKNAPDQTIDPADTSLVAWEVGGTELTRVDGGTWDSNDSDLLSWARGGPLVSDPSRRGVPSFVWVTYATQPFLPADVALAIQSVAATLYQRRGNDGVKSETLGAYSYQLAAATVENDLWQAAVLRYRRATFV